MTFDLDLSREACERRLGAALTEVTTHPDNWDQGVWAVLEPGTQAAVRASLERRETCGTASCLAGTGVIQAGLATLDQADDEPYLPQLILSAEAMRLLGDHPWCQRNWDTPNIDFGGLAALLFGLDIEQSTELFNSDRTLLEMWQCAERYTQGRVAVRLDEEVRVLKIDEERKLHAALEGA